MTFDITETRSASVILKDSNDEFIPLGSQARLISKKDTPAAVVGFDGEVYLDTLDKYNFLEVIKPSGEVCKVSFNYQKSGDDIPLIGPLICRKVQ